MNNGEGKVELVAQRGIKLKETVYDIGGNKIARPSEKNIKNMLIECITKDAGFEYMGDQFKVTIVCERI